MCEQLLCEDATLLSVVMASGDTARDLQGNTSVFAGISETWLKGIRQGSAAESFSQ